MSQKSKKKDIFSRPYKTSAVKNVEMMLKGLMPLEINFDPKNIFFRCVEDSNETIMISDKDGHLVYVNPAWSQTYGYSNAEAIGQTPGLLHSGFQSKEFYREMWSKIRDPKIAHWKGELVNRAKDGTYVPVFLTITPFKSEMGEILGYMGVALNMTQKKELEAKIFHQDRLASIGLLSSGLAHEVGTPLGVIRGRAEFLILQSKDELPKKDLEIIISQIDKISKLIRSLLRMGRRTSDFRIEEVSITQVVHEVLSLVGQNLKEDGVEIKTDISDEIKVKADYGRLEQTILNLVMNAIQAIHKAIRDGRKTGHQLYIKASVHGQKVAIEIKDTGCGIDPKNTNKLFKPFFTTKDVGEGTGLGLAIVVQLLKEMGGEISVLSELGVGSVFTIWFKVF